MLLPRFASTSAHRLPPTIRQLLSSSPSIQSSTTITVNGWIKSIRRQKKVSFAVISDGSSAQGLQAVLSDGLLAKRLTNGTSVRLSGRLTSSLGAGQEKELQVETLEVLGECDPETYPIQKQALSVEYLRDHSYLRARTDVVGAMLRLRDAMLKTVHEYFESQGFCYVHTPILTANDCEGAGEAFRIASVALSHPSPSESRQNEEFFSQPAYLTVSSQLHLEALSSAISRVYTLSPCFRAERSQTNRHLAEFWMLEAEWAFTNCVGDICSVVEEVLKNILLRHVHESEGESKGTDLALLWKGRNGLRRKALEEAAMLDKPWTRMTYTDAMKELESYHARSSATTFQFEPKWGRALQSEHERWLTETLINGPIFVTDYPASVKPFYMRLNPDDITVACFDLLVPYVGELVGGSLREERLDFLTESLRKSGLGLRREEYGWYTDLRRFGGAPHGGFGLGFERIVSWVSGIENIRECIPIPRWAGRLLL